MRFSLVLSGATAVTALTVPSLNNVKDFASRAVQLVDLSVFPKFQTLSPQQIAENAGQDSEWNPEAVPAPQSQVASGEMSAQAVCTTPAVRIEWRRLTSAQQSAYVQAAKCVFGRPARTGLSGASNRHMDMAALHQVMTPQVHGTAYFLPWHRYYLWVYERILREECSYTGPMTWWDEPLDAGRMSSSPVWGQYFGNGVKKTGNSQGTCITSGVFGSTTLTVGPGTSNQPHCLSRAVDDQTSGQVTKSMVDDCASHNNFTDMATCSYLGPHGINHNAVGAVMSDVFSSPGDPIFFLHHGFIDHNWRIWQNANPTGRLNQFNGCKAQSGACSPAGLDDVLSSRGIRPDVRVRDMMNTMGSTLCYKYDY